MIASCQPVIPRSCRCRWASMSPASRSSKAGLGTNVPIRSAAPSCAVPCSPPSGSRSNRPSAGSGVLASNPAISSALVLAQPPCPSLFSRNAGRPPVSLSSSCLLGVPRSNHSIRQPLPEIHSLSGCAAT